jgi:hypothetical protein
MGVSLGLHCLATIGSQYGQPEQEEPGLMSEPARRSRGEVVWFGYAESIYANSKFRLPQVDFERFTEIPDRHEDPFGHSSERVSGDRLFSTHATVGTRKPMEGRLGGA